MRIGHGFDVHAFGGTGPIVIGGVSIPFDKGILSHSDGDVLLHAVINALLGAIALGDIGKLFPDCNQKFKGANSRYLLHKVWRYVQNKNYRIGNIDITIIAQIPKMSPYTLQMRTHVANDLDCHIEDINIKSTTTENLGFIGRSEGIACEVMLLLIKLHRN